MQLAALDWWVIGVYAVATMILGVWFTRRAGTSVEEYFVAGRALPWWLAGTSIAATWFATDAPLAAASLVRRQGIYGNWLWWYEGAGILFLVFFYAKLWRRAEVLTDAELIELRYAGRPASILRGFTAVYQGVLKNCVVMGWVMLAMVKFSRVLLGWSPEVTLAVCVALALSYTVASGLWGVVVTDLLQFTTGMLGTLLLAGSVLYELGGPAAMAAKIRATAGGSPGTLDILPSPGHLSSLEMASYLCLIFVLWTRSAQGDGYIAQRLFATRDERQSLLASLWFSFAGTVLMTWPWIVVGLGSLVILPLAAASPELARDPELAYPMMLSAMMPIGLRGMLVASFLAAFMSTMDTHLCWGASYLVNDVYRRFLSRGRTEHHYVWASRVAVLVLVVLAALTAWKMASIERAWIYLIEVTAGVALVSLLRWYWWRINAWAEVSAMVASFVMANGLVWFRGADRLGVVSSSLLASVERWYGRDLDLIRAAVILGVCTLVWMLVTLCTPAVSDVQLERFYRRVRPGGWWGHIASRCPEIVADTPASRRWLGWFLGLGFVYGSLLGVGYFCIGSPTRGAAFTLVALGAGALTLRAVRRDDAARS